MQFNAYQSKVKHQAGATQCEYRRLIASKNAIYCVTVIKKRRILQVMVVASRSRKAMESPQSRVTPTDSPIVLAKADPEFLASLGRRVREVREQRGMARKILAQSADVSARYLAAFEAGEGNASVILLRRVAAALGVRPDLLDAG